jgi:hypothetical protein
MYECDSPELAEHVAQLRKLNAETRKLHAEAASSIALTVLFSVGAVSIALITYRIMELL